MKLQIIEQNGQRVLTTQELAFAFGVDNKRINDNFTNNKDRYQVGKHYFVLEGEELRAFKEAYPQISGNLKYAPILYLWTEKGAWMHAKSLNTDEAWSAYETLVDDYYQVKQQALDVSLLSPQMQMFHYIGQAVANLEIEAAKTKKELAEVKTTVETIQETFLKRDEDWRKSINSMLNAAAFRLGGNYSEFRNKSYEMLEERARCNLDIRLRNLVERLEEAGATKTQLKNTNRLSVIESDPRLKEIYTTIVKELAIGSLKVKSS